MSMLHVAYAIYLGGQFVYHRYKDAKTPWPSPSEVLRVPKTEEGTTVPIIMGRCRVDRPVVAWSGNLEAAPNPYDPNLVFFEGDVLYKIGIPFPDGTTLLQGIYVSGQRRENAGTPSDFAPNLNGSMLNIAGPLPSTRPDFVMITYEFGDGNSTQDMAVSNAATRMALTGIAANRIPGYQGYATLLSRFSINTVEIPAVAVEISTYPLAGTYFGGYQGPVTIGDELNPAHAIAAILCDTFGKLGIGIGTDILNQVSFANAASTLASEGFGYSRCWDQGETGREMIDEILEHIDGVLYLDQASGLFVLKLIRPDYDPSALLTIDPSNCERLDELTLMNGAGAPNKITVKYPDRGKEYEIGTTVALDQASAFAGEEREQTLSYPGCHTFADANRIAARELGARSRPPITCTAIVDRSFWDAHPGDAVRLRWPASHVSDVIMRIARPHRGGPTDNTMRLDLVQDVFYVYRNTVQPGQVAPFPDAAEILE
jgi:hypothetical protein